MIRRICKYCNLKLMSARKLKKYHKLQEIFQEAKKREERKDSEKNLFDFIKEHKEKNYCKEQFVAAGIAFMDHIPEAKGILLLTLTRHWFDKIALRKKKWEYRDIKPYWSKRLLYSGIDYTEIHFRNGYNKNCPFMRVEKHRNIYIKRWRGKNRFALKLGEILEIRNWEHAIQTKKVVSLPR